MGKYSLVGIKQPFLKGIFIKNIRNLRNNKSRALRHERISSVLVID